MKLSIKKLFATVLTVVMLITTAIGAQAQPNGKVRRAPQAIAGEYIVVLKDSVSAQDVPALANRLSRKHGGTVKFRFSRAIAGFSVRLNEQQALALSENPEVAYVEENGTVKAMDIQYNAPWGLDRIDQNNLPLTSTYNNEGLTGASVTVYVLDTGIRTTHQEFGGRAYIGADFIGDGWNGNDANGHGTHVAGTIGGSTYGVAKQVNLCSVRVLGANGGGTWDQVIAGIDWVTANHSGPSVVNMSLGGGASDSVDQAVRNSIASGVTYVLSAGNSSIDASMQSPARVSEAITVGATDSTDTRASFSNYGSVIDIFAPGVNILSASNSGDTDTTTKNGTSMAAPHVAGVAALHLQRIPAASPASVQTVLVFNATPDKVVNEGANTTRRLAHITNAPLYRIVAVHSGRVLDVMNDSLVSGAQVCQWDYYGFGSQQWYLVDVGGGACRIVSANSGKVLDVMGDSVDNGALICQWDYVGLNSQHWRIESVGGDAYRIVSVNSGKVLDVWGDSVANGAQICQWDYVGLNSQHWRLERVN